MSWLGEPSADDFGGRKLGDVDLFDGSPSWDVGPVVRELRVGKSRSSLNLVDSCPDSGKLKPKLKPSDPAEEGSDRIVLP